MPTSAFAAGELDPRERDYHERAQPVEDILRGPILPKDPSKTIHIESALTPAWQVELLSILRHNKDVFA